MSDEVVMLLLLRLAECLAECPHFRSHKVINGFSFVIGQIGMTGKVIPQNAKGNIVAGKAIRGISSFTKKQ